MNGNAFDYIIIGTGAAGCVVANRLSAEQDAAVLVDGVKIARSILANSAFAPFAGSEMLPGKNVQSDDELLAHLRAKALTVYHLLAPAKWEPIARQSLIL